MIIALKLDCYSQLLFCRKMHKQVGKLVAIFFFDFLCEKRAHDDRRNNIPFVYTTTIKT